MLDFRISFVSLLCLSSELKSVYILNRYTCLSYKTYIILFIKRFFIKRLTLTNIYIMQYKKCLSISLTLITYILITHRLNDFI